MTGETDVSLYLSFYCHRLFVFVFVIVFVFFHYVFFFSHALLVAGTVTGETDGNNKSSSPAHQEAILAFCLFTLFIYLLTFM